MHGEGDGVLAAELVSTMLNEGTMSSGMEEGIAAAVPCFAVDEAMASGRVVTLDDVWARVDG